MSAPPPLLAVCGLEKRFGGIRAIDGCTLSVRAGTITGLIGPNGAGKSTLFGLIAGVLKPDRGEISFRGRRIDGCPPHAVARLGIRRTFQIPRAPAALTVLENLMLVPLHQRGERLDGVLFAAGAVRREEARHAARAREVLETVGLAHQAELPAGQLSGGQKKLLELARCLMAEPALILLDEPVAGVNPTLIRHLVGVIRTLHARGITLCVIEHNIGVVADLCDPVLVLERGRLLAEGTPAEVRRDPRVLEAYLGTPAP